MKTTSLVIVSFAMLALSACAAPAIPGYEMMPKSQLYGALSQPRNLQRNISLGTIGAEKGLGGLIAPVTAEQYREGLALGLQQAGWYSEDADARYRLDAHMTEIDQPSFGFSFTVKSTAEYSLIDQKTGKVAYNDKLTLPCTKTISDAFNAEVRLRMATGCAVRENMTHFMKVLSQRY